jgi:hypothetical protein
MRTRLHKNYFFELVTIVVGIMLSFFINEWREDAKNKKKEIIYLDNLRTELLADTTKIREEIEILKLIERGADTLLTMNVAKRIPDSLQTYIKSQGLYSTLPLRRITYEELQQTGESYLIRNRDLLRDIITYYESVVWEIKEYNKIDENHVLNHVIPYYTANIDMDGGPISQQPFKDKLFRNLLRYNKGFKTIQVGLYKKQLEEIYKLNTAIEAELEKLGGSSS